MNSILHVLGLFKLPPASIINNILFNICLGCFILSTFKKGYYLQIINNTFKQILVPRFYLPLILILLLIIQFFDQPYSLWCKEHYNQDVYTFLDFICSLAEGWFVFGLLFTLIIISLVFNLRKLKLILQNCFISALTAGILNAMIKLIFSRERPVIAFEKWHFFRLLTLDLSSYSKLFYAYNSMSSGHTIIVTAALTPILFYTKNLYVRGLLILPIIVGFSRIYTLSHWLSDVFIAIIFGAIIGKSSYLLHKKSNL